MLAIGEIVTAEVTSPRVFGVFCQHNSQELLVLIPETSWIASFNSCLQFAQPGDRLRVVVKNVDPMSGKIAASVKDLYPNPWVSEEIAVGKTFNARVVRFVESADRCNDQPAFLVELIPGAYAMLRADDVALQPGATVSVSIVAADSRRHSIVIVPA